MQRGGRKVERLKSLHHKFGGEPACTALRRLAASALGKLAPRHPNEVLVVDDAKTKRTEDGTAVQSQGERRIGDFLSQRRIAYVYDERYRMAGDVRIRPDFYLPEFDLYIEYWGMDTPEYVENMKKKLFLYQRAGKKLISLSFRDFDQLEAILEEKLSRYIRL